MRPTAVHCGHLSFLKAGIRGETYSVNGETYHIFINDSYKVELCAQQLPGPPGSGKSPVSLQLLVVDSNHTVALKTRQM